MVVTLLGIVKEVRLAQLKNAELPIASKLLEMVTSLRLKQPENV